MHMSECVEFTRPEKHFSHSPSSLPNPAILITFPNTTKHTQKKVLSITMLTLMVSQNTCVKIHQ